MSKYILRFLAIKIKLMKGWVILCDFFNIIIFYLRARLIASFFVVHKLVHIRDGGGAS